MRAVFKLVFCKINAKAKFICLRWLMPIFHENEDFLIVGYNIYIIRMKNRNIRRGSQSVVYIVLLLYFFDCFNHTLLSFSSEISMDDFINR